MENTSVILFPDIIELVKMPFAYESILQFIADFNSQLRYNSNSHVRKYTNISLVICCC